MIELAFDPASVMVRDRFRLQQQFRQFSKIAQTAPDTLQGKALHDWQAAVMRSQRLVTQRASTRPAITYDDGLPITARLDDIREALTNHQVVIVAGETGSGKTTQLPKLCLEMGRGICGRVGHTQPRRLAARAVSERLAEELKCTLGKEVGFQIRFTDQTAPETLVKVMTDGILLAETQKDPYLNAYDTLIIDEAHERSLNIDFLLGFLKRLLPRRPDLKVIVTSATIDVERFSQHFSTAPVIEVSGRTYPVEVRYRPLYRQEETESDLSIQEGVLHALEEIDAEDRALRKMPGDVLVFLVGEREIREMALLLRKVNLPNTEILPLYARLGANEQHRIFQKHAGRRVILSTNVAETSLTVPGIRYVIDSGEVRMSRYSYRSKVQRLPVEPVSRASADQRKGRCGRVAEGICYRLYSEEDFNQRPAFTDPEILRTNLAAVILQMLVLKLGDIDRFPFMQPPERAYINDGYKLLEELGAVTDKRQLTSVGRQLARFPVDPRLGRVLLAGHELQSLHEVLIIVSALSQQDPRERPMDRQQAADERHAQWADDNSDFLALINLWNGFEAQRQALSNSKIREYCRKQFLSYLRLREWKDTHRQLVLICQDLGFRVNETHASYEQVHRALLTGLLTQVGNLDEKNEYISPRQRRFVIAPGTRVRKASPKWVVAAELTETQRLFARTVARIEPEWIEQIAAPLLKAAYSEPHWSRKRGEVCAYLQLSLYGLPIVVRRRVSYGRIDPIASRDLFIRSALVEGEITTRCEFVSANQACIESVETLENKVRRRDLLVSEDQLYDFYDARLPADVHNVRALEAWYKSLDEAGRQHLRLTREALLTEQGGSIDENRYPDMLESQGLRFPLTYQFAPGDRCDGVTLRTPLGALPQLPLDRLEWLVPGLLPEKIEALLRGLPKSLRKHFVPVPDFARALSAALSPEGQKLTDAMSARLRQMTGTPVPPEAWVLESLPPHLRINIQVVDDSGAVLDQDRDFHALYARMEAQLKQQKITAPKGGLQTKEGLTAWSFGQLPESVAVKQHGMQIELYPFLRDCGATVALEMSYDRRQAEHEMQGGLARLILLRLKTTADYLRKQLPHKREIGLYFAPVGKVEDLLDDFLIATIQRHFLSEQAQPTSAEAFDALIERGRAEWVSVAESMAGALLALLKQYHSLSKSLGKVQNLALALFMGDVKHQLAGLVFPGFLRQVPWEWIEHYPRYFKALEMRLEKMPRQLAAERQFRLQFEQHWQRYVERHQRHQREGIVDPELERYRWMLEEYRVSVFAQQLGTLMSVSDKKLEKQFDKVRN